MNLFNRILIVFVALLFMAISLLILLQLLQIETFGINETSLLPYEWLLLISKSDLKTRLALGGSCLSVFVFGAVLIYLELHPLFSVEKRFLVTDDDLGKVEIAKSCIGQLVNYEAGNLSGVLKASSRISDKKDGLHIKSELTVEPHTKVIEVAEELRSIIKAKTQEKLGLYVAEVSINTTIQEKQPTNRQLQ